MLIPENREVDEEGYLIGETDPLINCAAEGGAEDFSGEERDETSSPLVTPVASALDLIEDSPDTFFIGEDATVDAEAMTDLYGKLYKFAVDFGDAGGVMAIEDRSSSDPEFMTGEVLEARDTASPFTDTGSVSVLRGEESREGDT